MPAVRESGVRKQRKQQQRRDRDGDLVMGAADRASAKSRRPPPPTNRNLVELRVTGWTEGSEVPKITKFLERHAAKRSAGPKGGPMTTTLIKKSRTTDGVLILSVRPEDVPAFSKINGFSFASTKGEQKLDISGPGVRSKSAPEDKEPPSSGASEITTLLTGFLERRYDPSTKLLNLSTIQEDDAIRSIGMFETPARQAKFFPVLMTVVDRQLKTPDAKREAIESVTLSGNNLPNLGVVRDMAISLPHIKNLDLSGNQLADTKDLAPFKKLQDLEHLIVTGNPMESKQNFQKDLLRWFPRLRMINTLEVRSEEQLARLAAPKQTPAPSSVNIWMDPNQVAQSFLLEFFQGFDADRNALVQKYYDSTSVFTMAVNARARGGAGKFHDKTPWDAYLPQSRNLVIIHGKRSRYNRKYRGLQNIQKAFAAIPPTRHSGFAKGEFSMDCQPQPGLPDPTGQYPAVTGLMVVVHGDFEEHRTAKGADEIVRRAFDRTFILGPGGPAGVRVITDMCSLRAAGGFPAWIPVEAAVQSSTPVEPALASAVSAQPNPVQVPPAPVPGALTAEQEAMVLHVHQATRLTPEYAKMCLESANWDLEAAAQLFNAQKDTIPPEAFVQV